MHVLLGSEMVTKFFIFFRKRVDGVILALVLALRVATWTIRGRRARIGAERNIGRITENIKQIL